MPDVVASGVGAGVGELAATLDLSHTPFMPVRQRSPARHFRVNEQCDWPRVASRTSASLPCSASSWLPMGAWPKSCGWGGPAGSKRRPVIDLCRGSCATAAHLRRPALCGCHESILAMWGSHAVQSKASAAPQRTRSRTCTHAPRAAALSVRRRTANRYAMSHALIK
jgi:hypothetical protein